MEDLGREDLEALKRGIVNLEKHIENLQQYGVPVIVTLNAFITDTKAETDFVEAFVKERGCDYAYSEVWEKGGEGGIALAEKILDTIDHKKSDFAPIYELDRPLAEKIETVAKKIYGAGNVSYTKEAERALKKITSLGFGNLPVCMAKTQYSLSDDPTLLGRPEGFTLTVRDAYVSSGAGFVVALTGQIVTMPGLPKHPAAYDIDVNNEGKIEGLF